MSIFLWEEVFYFNHELENIDIHNRTIHFKIISIKFFILLLAMELNQNVEISFFWY